MITLNSLETFLDNYLYFDKSMSLEEIDPSMTNGLMVKGKEGIQKVGFGVSASISLFEKAYEKNCDCVVVHHSFNFPSCNVYDVLFQNRIGFLIKHDMSLFGYHFLLDSHPEVGNNVQILQTIGAQKEKPYTHHDDPWGWMGRFNDMVTLKDIENKLQSFLSPRTLIYPFGPSRIQKVVVISGKGAPLPSYMNDLIEERIDLFITGEIHEWNRELFREAHIHCIAGGHYHTEVFGVTALMEKVKGEFPSLSIEWLEVENEV